MKTSILLMLLSMTLVSVAQTQQGFNYQAALRNVEGAIMLNQEVVLRISLVNATDSDVLYSETHSVTTNEQGIVNLQVGSGNQQNGSLTNVQWNNMSVLIKVELQTGDSGFKDMGTTPLMPVPYAMFAASGNQGPQGEQGQTGEQGPQGIPGINGIDGKTILNGQEDPTASIGFNGDFYLNTTTNSIFGPKTNVGWGSGTSLIGAQGLQGVQGPQGETGPQGAQGISIQWLGSFASQPSNPTLNQAYYNQTLKKSFVFNGSAWQIISQDGADAVNAVTGTGTTGKIAVWSGETQLANLESFNIDPNVAVISNPSAGDEDPIFEVKNKEGKVVFGVYQTGVRIYVDDNNTKAAKGGFAVGGLSTGKDNENLYFRVTPDSVRVLIRESDGKAAKGGFAVGGISTGKSGIQDLFFINPDSARIYINTDDSKVAKGGFAVGGLSTGKGSLQEEYLRITRDSARINVSNENKAAKGGFAVGGISTGKGEADNFMHLTPENYFIGHEAGSNISTGKYNTFLGYKSGKANTSGQYNSFIGYGTGLSNTIGSSNVFIGNESGRTNTSGENNVFLGYYAGYTNNASNNVFLGNEAGRYNTTGANNTFMGYLAGRANTSGKSNVFLGKASGTWTTTGSSNLFIGEESGYSNITGENNIFLGRYSGYSGTALKYNIFIGDSAGYFSNNQFAKNNVFVGYAAGKNTQSYNNVFIGNMAGWSNAEGQNNIAIGDKAGYSNMTSQNIFIGTEAGWKNTEGFFNIIIGRHAAHNLTTGSQQIIIGGGAGGSLTTGAENLIIGTNAGSMNNGNKNIFIGNSAGWSNTGSNNIIMGYKVGYSYFQSVSNRLIIDNSQVATPLVWGEFDNRRFGINTTSPSYTFYVNGTAGGTSAWTVSSDNRLKKNVATLPNALDRVLKLRGVSYEWKDAENPDKGVKMGFIAQEAEAIIPEVVSKEGEYYSMQYAPITALLVEALKELKKENDILKARLEAIEAEIKK